MTSLYWAVDPRDWDFPTYGHGASMVNHVITAVEHYIRPGAVILSHDFRKPDTVTAYATLLPWLKARYRLVGMPT
jgi:peptidoglycan-N-acetylglucosamine deacetylase